MTSLEFVLGENCNMCGKKLSQKDKDYGETNCCMKCIRGSF